ncbi:hypothetical protein OPV22_012943 [Ensete ventricosum]|uniref:Uncharacterized protein n=1 Tax=Ensete ventricosum TaxID=4639 RepID=A0AAV8R486_ENSVE|nr:hypothetical protein OPV22_012943 [Ensete ventricosum]
MSTFAMLPRTGRPRSPSSPPPRPSSSRPSSNRKKTKTIKHNGNIAVALVIKASPSAAPSTGRTPRISRQRSPTATWRCRSSDTSLIAEQYHRRFFIWLHTETRKDFI